MRDDVSNDQLTRRGTLAAGAALAASVPRASGAASNLQLVSPEPDDPFEYPYFLWCPETASDERRPLLVQPNNTGTATDDFERHRTAARDDARRGFGRRLAETLGVPLLVPVFPRPESDPVDWRHYVHQLDTETMRIDSGPLERVDRQLLGMIADARERLSLPLTERVMLNGFSASGNFVNRFTVLHPEAVTSVTAGGVNGMVTLPIRAAKGHTLNYQVGVADLESLTGSPFDAAAFREVDQYLYMGSADENDTLPAGDAWNDEQRALARDVYGEDMQTDRFPYCESVYEDFGARATFELYDGVGHAVTDAIVRDVAQFHREHAPVPDDAGDGVPPASVVGALEATGIPVEAALAGSAAVLGVLGYLFARSDE